MRIVWLMLWTLTPKLRGDIEPRVHDDLGPRQITADARSADFIQSLHLRNELVSGALDQRRIFARQIQLHVAPAPAVGEIQMPVGNLAQAWAACSVPIASGSSCADCAARD